MSAINCCFVQHADVVVVLSVRTTQSILSSLSVNKITKQAAKIFLPDDVNGGDLDDAVRWAQGQNWTSDWLELVAENPTARFTRAEYMPQSEQVCCVRSAICDNYNLGTCLWTHSA